MNAAALRKSNESSRAAPLERGDAQVYDTRAEDRSTGTRRRRAAVIVNAASGSVEKNKLAELRASLDHFDGPQIVSFITAAPDGVSHAVEKALSNDPDVIAIVGGDGTARSVAEAAAPSGVPIAPLPYGTMNILPHRIYGARSGPAIMRALGRARVETIPAGRVNGRLFLLSAALGFPVTLARAREDARHPDLAHLTEAVMDLAQGISESAEERIVYRGEDRTPRRAAGLVLTTAPAESLLDACAPWRGAQAFEIIGAKTRGLGDVLRLGSRALADEWRDDESVEVSTSTVLKAYVSGETLVGLDGDPVSLSSPLSFTFETAATPILVPDTDG